MIGFACIILNGDLTVVQNTEMRKTTVKSFSQLNKREQEKKIENLAFSNVLALENQIRWLTDQPPQYRFMRITSDLLPLYTHPLAVQIYNHLKNPIADQLSKIGQMAKLSHIRLTSHPAQFCVLNNPNPLITQNTIDELEYHNFVFDMMNIGFVDGCVVNIHGGKRENGLVQLVENSKQLSASARSRLSIENDEFSFGLDSILESPLPDYFPIVVDIHHHWINSGNYIEANDPRWQTIHASWRGLRPKIHVSLTPEDLVVGLSNDPQGRPIITEEKRGRFRRHSNLIWNKEYCKYALTFHQHGDLMIEAKYKNLAARQMSI